jgi:hypothetical protein
MVYDSGKRPDGFNNDDQWHIPEHNPFEDPYEQSEEALFQSMPLKRKAKKEKVAQVDTTVPKVGPIPIGFPLPKVPWVTQEDLWNIYNYIKSGRNPFTGKPIGSEEEKKALNNLTGEQVKGFNQTKYKDELEYAVDSFRNKRGCTCIQEAMSFGNAAHGMAVEAITGAEDPTLIIDPNGHAARFDGMYPANYPGNPHGSKKDYDRLQNKVFQIENVSPQNKAQEAKEQARLAGKVPEWAREAQIANACGYSMRVSITDSDLVQHLKQRLTNVPPGFQIIEGHLGGTYGQVRANTVGGEVHHMPANEVNPLSRAKGSAIWMYPYDHANTKSSGSSDEAKDYRAKQRELIKQGKTREAIFEDIKDVKAIAPSLYDISIQQMLKKYKRSQPNAGKK